MRPLIADPYGAPASPEESRVFRLSFWRIYFGSLLLCGFVMVPVLGTVFWFVSPQMFRGSGRIALTVALFLAVALNPLAGALGAVLRPVKVTRRGIYGPPLIGFVEWERMKGARTFWLGQLWARIALPNSLFALWIPLALHDFNAFSRTLEEWAPENNPLRVWAL